jgi:hypothetical protein
VPEIEGHAAEQVLNHIPLLMQADLITAIDASSMDGADYMAIGLTWQGHEFLDNVRDPDIWKTTKAGAAKVGSFSIGLVSDLAKAAILAKAQRMGFPSDAQADRPAVALSVVSETAGAPRN